MRISPVCRRAIPALLIVLFAVSFCYADQKSVQVIGTTECGDCDLRKIKHSDAVKGLKVSIDCKLANGEMKRRAEGKLDAEGKFSVDIPQDLLEDGKKLKEECYAQLHGSSNLPCAAHNGLESTKLSFVSETNGKHTFSPAGKLKFSPSTCTSEFLWPWYKHPWYKHPWFKHPWFKKPYVVVVPKYKPVYKPVYKKPIYYTPTVPVHKPSYYPPVHKEPSYYPPVYKKPYYPPVYKKPYYPPVYKKPYYPPVTYTPTVPVYKKPCPDIPIPTIDPKVFIHPKYKKWPFFPPKP